MRAVEDLDVGAFVGPLERERDGTQVGREVLVGHAGDVEAVLDEGQVRDRLLAALALGDGVGERRLAEFHVFEIEGVDFAGAVHAEQQRGGVRPLAARRRDVDVAGDRVDGHVVEEELLGVDADHRGDLVVDAFDLGPVGALGGRAVAGVEGEDGGALRVADEENAFGSEGQRAGRLQVGRALVEAVGEVGAAGGGEEQRGGQGRQEETGRAHGPSPCDRGRAERTTPPIMPHPGADASRKCAAGPPRSHAEQTFVPTRSTHRSTQR